MFFGCNNFSRSWAAWLMGLCAARFSTESPDASFDLSVNSACGLFDASVPTVAAEAVYSSTVTEPVRGSHTDRPSAAVALGGVHGLTVFAAAVPEHLVADGAAAVHDFARLLAMQ